ncbi:MAG TPA: histidine kinase, partial [Exiguobacterium sp.]|nr:histidine kinase [Exiguobacterium sp.]
MKRILRDHSKDRPYRLRQGTVPASAETRLTSLDQREINRLQQNLRKVELKLKQRNEIMEALATQNVDAACETVLTILLQLLDVKEGAILLYRREQLNHFVAQGIDEMEL